MSYRSLREFIETLEKSGDLVRVSEPVSTHLEMTEIQTRVLADGGPALLFENVRKENGDASSMPVLVNLFGTLERVARGMGRSYDDLRELGRMLAFLRQPEPPKSFSEARELWPLAKSALALKPKTVKKAAVHEIVLEGDEVDLDILPIQTCWPGEPAPLITWPIVVTKGPGDRPEDDYNLGIYRMQKLGRTQTLMRWLKHRGGAQHHARWQESNKKPLPAAVVIGADPATILDAVTPLT